MDDTTRTTFYAMHGAKRVVRVIPVSSYAELVQLHRDGIVIEEGVMADSISRFPGSEERFRRSAARQGLRVVETTPIPMQEAV